MQFAKSLFSLPVLVLVLFFCTFIFGNLLDITIKSNLYAISILIKDLIVCILPIIIFSFVSSGIMNLQKESTKIILILVPLVCISNFLGFWISYTCAGPLLKSGAISISKLDSGVVLHETWHICIKPLIKNDIALILGVIVGILAGIYRIQIIKKTIETCAIFSNFILKKIICPALPLFVLGFIVKMQHEGSLIIIAKEYSQLLAIVAILTYGYMFFLLFCLSNFNIRATLTKAKNVLQGVIIGLCSMSSAAAIPVTIKGSEKNLDNPDIAKFVIPATANMHLLGDCFAIPVIGLAIMISFGQGLPSPLQYLVFSLYGVVAKFAAAGIPGGSAVIFAPIFEQIFGFDQTMVTALTAIYMLFDPIATSSNVFGHGVFAVLFEKVYTYFNTRNKYINK